MIRSIIRTTAIGIALAGLLLAGRGILSPTIEAQTPLQQQNILIGCTEQCDPMEFCCPI